MIAGKLKRLSKLRAEELSKRNKALEEERIDTIGQENEIQGAKWAQEEFRAKEKQQQEYKFHSYEILDQLRRKNKKSYNLFLLKLLNRAIYSEDLPKKYVIWTKANKKGIIAGILGTKLYSAFESSGIQKYDFMAVKTLALKIANTVSYLQGNRENQNGILIPNQLDIKKAKSKPKV